MFCLLLFIHYTSCIETVYVTWTAVLKGSSNPWSHFWPQFRPVDFVDKGIYIWKHHAVFTFYGDEKRTVYMQKSAKVRCFLLPARQTAKNNTRESGESPPRCVITENNTFRQKCFWLAVASIGWAVQMLQIKFASIVQPLHRPSDCYTKLPLWQVLACSAVASVRPHRARVALQTPMNST